MADIFVGNLAGDVTEQDLRREFQAFGELRYVSIILDRRTRKSRGFAFVKMPVELQASAAAATLNRKELRGRPMRVVQTGPEVGAADAARGNTAPDSKEWGWRAEW
jgi:RNA recognition motif-containing protein